MAVEGQKKYFISIYARVMKSPAKNDLVNWPPQPPVEGSSLAKMCFGVDSDISCSSQHEICK